MDYAIRIFAMGRPHPSVDIDADRYTAIKRARDHVVQAIQIEELFDSLVLNYRDLELRLFAYAADGPLRGDKRWTDLHDARNDTSRLIANLLSSCRLYLDALLPQVKAIIGKPARSAFEGWMLGAEKSLEFRFMELVRNYSQHNGAVVYSLVSQWRRHEAAGGVEHGISPHANLEDLAADPRLREGAGADISAIRASHGDEPDLRPILRSYLDSIREIHAKARGVMEADLKLAEKTIDDAIQLYKDAGGVDLLGLSAVVIDGPVMKDDVPLLPEMLERRSTLVKRHRSGVKLSTMILSSVSWKAL